jgi:hypothetical protein
MAEHHITCEDCGGPYVASRSDARRCASCRVLRILAYVAAKFRPRNCRACKETYRPVSRGDRTCAGCTPPPKNRNTVVTCVLCKQDTPPYERLPVCLACVKGMETQPLVVRALQKGRAARIAQYRDTAATST